MKLIQSASLLVVDPDEQARTTLGLALRGLGLGRLAAVATLAEAEAYVAANAVDACVVAIEAARLEGDLGLRSVPERLAALLLSTAPTRADMRAAALAGYGAVLARPAPARIVYRRIGSLLQRARRVARAARPFATVGGPVDLPAVSEAKE